MNTLQHSLWVQYTRQPNSPFGLALVVAAHLAVAWAVLHSRPDMYAIESPQPLQVRLVSPDTQEAEPARPLPRPAATTRLAPARLLAVRQNMPSPAIATPPAPAVAEIPPSPSNLETVAPTAPNVPATTATVTVTQPRFDASYVDNPTPLYPGLSRRLVEEGRVMLRVFVSADGLPEKIELRQSSGFSRLDTAALETVRRWRFIPARFGEERVGAWVLVPISFSLRS